MPESIRKTRWAWTLATFFGAGFLKPGPGTYGSAAALLLWYAAAHIFHPGFITLAIATLIAAILATAIGIPASTIVAREAGREDPGFVVIDEVAGQLIALILAAPVWSEAILALLLFRLFDIWKPWPIRRLEELPEGTGIMLDDVAAGILALITFVLLELALQAAGIRL
jgi:phosphatidylglycerophosphatase A